MNDCFVRFRFFYRNKQNRYAALTCDLCEKPRSDYLSTGTQINTLIETAASGLFEKISCKQKNRAIQCNIEH